MLSAYRTCPTDQRPRQHPGMLRVMVWPWPMMSSSLFWTNFPFKECGITSSSKEDTINRRSFTVVYFVLIMRYCSNCSAAHRFPRRRFQRSSGSRCRRGGQSRILRCLHGQPESYRTHSESTASVMGGLISHSGTMNQ